jgi:plastocyanin
MRSSRFWSLALLGLFLPGLASSAESAAAGIIKGTITVGGRPTSDAVVSVEGLPQEKGKSQKAKGKSDNAVMDQREMKFVPRVLPVLAGAKVDFPNNDKTFHNVFSTSEAKKFDLGLYSSGESRSVTFDKPGVVKILCNVHPSMEAYIVVKGHPNFAAADLKGNYRLNGVPLGRYRIEIWHPEFGMKAVSFNLAREGEVLGIDVDLKKQK